MDIPEDTVYNPNHSNRLEYCDQNEKESKYIYIYKRWILDTYIYIAFNPFT